MVQEEKALLCFSGTGGCQQTREFRGNSSAVGPGALHKDEDVPGMALGAEPGIEMWDEAIPALLWVRIFYDG